MTNVEQAASASGELGTEAPAFAAVIPSEPNLPPSVLSQNEVSAFAGQDEWRMRHARFKSLRDISLSYVLFGFVLGINCWWDWHVMRWINWSGIKGHWFHLNDSVLIALATTSVANFIGLVAIVAKHLFPEVKEGK